MFGLFFGVLLGGIVAFVLPPTIPRQFRSGATDNGIRVLGVLIVLFSALSTSFVSVPDGHLGQLFRVYGGSSLREGKIVAVNGENGPQASRFPSFQMTP